MPVSQEQVDHHIPARKSRDMKPASFTLNMTSMIDVVFQLLIYFVITASFVMGEGVITANFPSGSGPSQPDPLDPKQPIRITLSSRGESGYRLDVDRAPTAPSTFGELAKMLEGMQVGKGGFFEADNPVVIAPSGDVRWQHVVNAFNAAVRARYKNIAFSQANQ